MEKKKTVYHSALTGPVRVSVESDALTSKYAQQKNLGQDDPGYYYLFMKVDGEDHTYSAENQRCANTLASYKGKGDITVEAHGRGKEAFIEVKGATESSAPPSSPATPAVDPEAALDLHSKKLQKAYIKALERASEVKAQWNLEHKDNQMNVEIFQAMTSYFAINFSQRGLIEPLSPE